jgi:23S rRNA (cytosine1962-C5)-methyltransferase
VQNNDFKDFNLELILNQRWSAIHDAGLRDKNQCYRLLHDLKYDFQMDVYGETLWVYWYKGSPVTQNQIQIISDFSDSKKMNFVIRHMINRGVGVGGLEAENLIKSPDQLEKWTAKENQIQFQLRTNAGFSPGLFLDQSQNRKWVCENSSEKTVLNLFSYTSGFSLAAALGKALNVTTVDASSNFLNWSKENFILNGLNPDHYEFFSQDVLLFLTGAEKRKRTWDLIICDPPSFGRTKTTVWKIEKNLPELILKMWACLSDKGQILFTCNYEKWTLSDLEKVFKKTLFNHKIKIQNLPQVSLDFELTESTQNLTKGFFIQKI